MDDKVFNLLEKVYLELQEVKSDVAGIKDNVQKMGITLENTIKPNMKMCLDEIVSVKEKQTEHDQRFDKLEENIDRHGIEISVIKKRA